MFELLTVVVFVVRLLSGAGWILSLELAVTVLLWGQIAFGVLWLLFTLTVLLLVALGFGLGGALVGGGAGLEVGGDKGGVLGAIGGSILGAGLVGVAGLIGIFTYLLRKALVIGGSLMVLHGIALLAIGGGWMIWVVIGAVMYLAGFVWYRIQKRRAKRSSSSN